MTDRALGVKVRRLWWSPNVTERDIASDTGGWILVGNDAGNDLFAAIRTNDGLGFGWFRCGIHDEGGEPPP